MRVSGVYLAVLLLAGVAFVGSHAARCVGFGAVRLPDTAQHGGHEHAGTRRAMPAQCADEPTSQTDGLSPNTPPMDSIAGGWAGPT
jgi:hypothetical protein